eukprot:8746988-Alexandrium_andersonii.AAC.1
MSRKAATTAALSPEYAQPPSRRRQHILGHRCAIGGFAPQREINLEWQREINLLGGIWASMLHAWLRACS